MVRLSRKVAPGWQGDGKEPLYYRLQQEIRKHIEMGKWAPGQAIPPERQLAQDYGVSLGTIRKAILNLGAEGFLYRRQGKGTIVAGTHLVRALRYYRYVAELGDKEPPIQIKLLGMDTLPGDPRINRLLKIKKDEELLKIARLISIHKKPMVVSVSYLSRPQFAALESFPRARLEKVPLYLAIEDCYRLPTKENRELMAAGLAGPEVAKLLEVEEGRPLLVIEMLSLTYRGRAYEYRVSHCLTGELKMYRNY